MMVYLTRRYRFSASHRLHNDALTKEENARVYGRCNSLHGHGHNYVLEVTLEGPIEVSTGMVIDLTALDRIVNEEVLERFDLKHLNLDVETFRTRVPTTENLCVEIFGLLQNELGGGQRWQARLARVRLEETKSNFFEYEGERTGTLGEQKGR